jgi:hypothetical protein
MSNFMMNVISWILLLLVILTLYLIDKVNHLTQLQKTAPPVEEDSEMEPPGDILFAGLEGKRLWDAMNGRPIQGFDAQLIDALRVHYEPILRAHIEATFKDGLNDGRAGVSNSPASQRKLDTPRGFVNAWLPSQHLGSIYRVAHEFVQLHPDVRELEDLTRLRQTLDSVTQMLHQRVNIPLQEPYSQWLVVDPEPVATEPDSDEALALTDQSQVETLPSQALERVQVYEEQQRQDIAAEQDAQSMNAVVIEPQAEVKVV